MGDSADALTRREAALKKLMHRILHIARASALAAAVVLAGCGGDSTTSPERSRPEPFVLGNYVDMTREAGLSLVDRDDSTLVFAVSGGAPELTAGDLIVGSEDGGYIGRIVSARRAGSRLIVATSPAFVTDAVISGGADTSITLRFDSGELAEGAPGGSPLRLVEAAPGATVSPGGISLDGVVLHEGPALGGDLSAVIQRGRIEYEPALDLGLRFSPKTVSGARAVLSGRYSLEFEALVEAAAPCYALKGITIAALERDVVMRIGGFPVAARITLRYHASIYLRGGFAGTCAIRAAAAGDLGFGASRSGAEWTGEAVDAVVFGVPDVELPDHTETRVSIEVWPAFEIAFYRTPCMTSSQHVAVSYFEWDGGAPVLEWQKKGTIYGYFSFAAGSLDRRDVARYFPLPARNATLDEGPYKTGEYILVAQWGRAGTGDGEFGYPKGVAVDGDGFVYVVDNVNDRVQRFTSAGVFVSAWGGTGAGTGRFNGPEKIAIDAGGVVYVTDAGNRRVQRFTRDGIFISTWGGEGTGEGEFLHPFGVAAGDGLVWVSDNLAHRVQRFTADGSFLSAWGSQGSGDGEFDGPSGCAYRAGGGRVVVCDCRNDRVGRFLPAGGLDGWFGAGGAGDGEFHCPSDAAVDGAGSIYVCDLGNDRVQIFSPSGVFVAKLGSTGSGEGEFDHPEGIAVDAQGNLYVADGRNHRIQKFAPRFR